MLLCRALIVTLFIVLAMPAAQADQHLAQQIFKELVDSNTAPSGGGKPVGRIAIMPVQRRGTGGN